MPATQAVGIGDDGDGARGHCCCGEQRTEQEPSKGIEQSHRDGNAQAIVDESTKQVLAHIAHSSFRDGDGRHHPLEASTDQRDIGGLNRHIRSGSNRKADISLGEGWRIIDAVTHHPHLLSFQLQFLDLVCFVLWEHFGQHTIHTNLSSNRLCCAPVSPVSIATCTPRCLSDAMAAIDSSLTVSATATMPAAFPSMAMYIGVLPSSARCWLSPVNRPSATLRSAINFALPSNTWRPSTS